MTATFSSSPLWFITRSTGIVAFVLLTVTTVLGIVATRRSLASARWPRFANQLLHRNASLLALIFLLVHIGSTVLDSYVSVGWLAVLVPGASAYKTTQVALGTLAFDLLLVAAATGLARGRMPARAWRALHLVAYAAWPLALVHFLATGTDTSGGGWGVWLGAGCAATVAAAAAVRILARQRPGLARSVTRGVARSVTRSVTRSAA
jgi:predicted ferric reductase